MADGVKLEDIPIGGIRLREGLTLDEIQAELNKPRVLTADELRGMPHGHGWVEYYPYDPEIPFDEYLQECVWLGCDFIERDVYGCVSNGSNMYADDDYYNAPCGNGWRIWTGRPTEEHAKAVKWDGIG